MTFWNEQSKKPSFNLNGTNEFANNDQIANWPALLLAVKRTSDPSSAANLRSRYPYQVTFVLLKGKIDDPAYFEEIPFNRITTETIASARKYIDNPSIPLLLTTFGMNLPPDRYEIMPDGKIGRKSNSAIDKLIVQIAQCLSDRGMLRDGVEIADAAYDAIIHYQKIPLVSYFFSLPYIEGAMQIMTFSPNDGLIAVYKGVEGLLMEIYNELGEGQTVSDSLVKKKILQMMNVTIASEPTAAGQKINAAPQLSTPSIAAGPKTEESIVEDFRQFAKSIFDNPEILWPLPGGKMIPFNSFGRQVMFEKFVSEFKVNQDPISRAELYQSLIVAYKRTYGPDSRINNLPVDGGEYIIAYSFTCSLNRSQLKRLINDYDSLRGMMDASTLANHQFVVKRGLFEKPYTTTGAEVERLLSKLRALVTSKLWKS